MTRLVFTLILAVSSMLAANNLANAASDPSLDKDQVAAIADATPSQNLLREFKLPRLENSSRLDREASLQTELAQMYWPVATVCYTYAGPTCGMVVAVPQGSACTCYYNNGWLAGTAW